MSRPSDKVRKLREAVKAEALAKWEHNLEVAEAMDWETWQELSPCTKDNIASLAYEGTRIIAVQYIFDKTCSYCKAYKGIGSDSYCNYCPLYAGDGADVSCCTEWENVHDALLYTYTTYTKEQFITAVKAMIAKIEGIDVSLPKKEYLTQCRTGNTDDIYYPEDMYSPEDM